jgi:hypothetical protein
MSTPKSKIGERFVKPVKKPVQARPSLIAIHKTPVISSLASPIRIIKTIKSQSNLYYPSRPNIKSPKASLQVPQCKLAIKSIEKKVSLLNDEDDEPSPIESNRGKGFFSMTEEEFTEFNLFLKDLKK